MSMPYLDGLGLEGAPWLDVGLVGVTSKGWDSFGVLVNYMFYVYVCLIVSSLYLLVFGVTPQLKFGVTRCSLLV